MKKTSVFIVFISLMTLAVVIYEIGSYYYASFTAEKAFNSLAKDIDQGTDKIAKIKKLAEENPDLVGWLTIDGTKIDYPVMQTPDDEQYYLHSSFDKNYSKSGTLFLASACDWQEPSFNIIIYGHNMKSGTMFGGLKKYRSSDYWVAHEEIEFTTLEKDTFYEIFAVIKTDTTAGAFIYNMVDIQGTAFDDTIDKLMSMSLYEIGITPQYGDYLITLSTCESSSDNSRLVIIGKKSNN